MTKYCPSCGREGCGGVDCFWVPGNNLYNTPPRIIKASELSAFIRERKKDGKNEAT